MTIETQNRSPGRELAVRPTTRDAVDRWKRVPTVLTPKRIDPGAPAARRRAAVSTVKGTARIAAAPVYDATFGAGDAVRLYFRWLFDADARDQAIAKESLHSYTKVHREAVKNNFIITGVLLVILLLGAALLWWLTPGYVQALLISLIWATLIARGWALTHRHKDKGDAAAAHTVDLKRITSELLTERATAAGRIKKESVVRLLPPGFRSDGIGYKGTLLLPLGAAASDQLRFRSDWAHIFEVDENALVMSKPTGGHAGQLEVWATRDDPFADGSGPHPLLRERTWNAWDPAPFALNARRENYNLRLFGSNMLIGAKPKAGKSVAGYSAAAPYILDPNARIMVANGLNKTDWDALEPISDWYLVGASDDNTRELLTRLDDLIAEMDRRYEVMRAVGIQRCPERALTEELSRDPELNMPLTLLIIDEFHNFLENGEPGDRLRGKPATLGQNIAARLTHLGRSARAAGIIMLLITQKPDSGAMPTVLRDQIGTRFGLRMLSWRASDMILGELSADGYNCKNIPAAYPGLGIMVPDMENTEAEVDSYPTLRTYYLNAHAGAQLCQQGLRNREEAGTLPRETGPESPRVAYAVQVQPETREPAVVDAELISDGRAALPEPKAIEMSPIHIEMLTMLGKLPREEKVIPTESLAYSLNLSRGEVREALAACGLAEGVQSVPASKAGGKRTQPRGYKVRDAIRAINRYYATPGDAEIVDIRR